MRKHITSQFIFVPAVKFVFSCTTNSFNHHFAWIYFIVKFFVFIFNATENASKGTDFVSL